MVNKWIYGLATSGYMLLGLSLLPGCEKIEPERLVMIRTGAVSDVTRTSCVAGGVLLDVGGSGVTGRGICWSTDPSPTLDDASFGSGTGKGEFTCVLEGLNPDTRYYIRAYASNSAGTSYGNEKNITTLPQPEIPSVLTHDVTDIGATSATCGGSVTKDGGSPIIARGLCWGTGPEPSHLSENVIQLGAGSDPWSLEITGLQQDTRYYIRAFATNEMGTGYGNDLEFRTLFICGSQLEDQRDGKVYNTVSIGEQCWMAENLNAGEMILSDAEPVAESGIEKYCYDDDPGNCELYGGLYTWDELMQNTLVESSQGVCPEGWHVPSDYEWKLLERTIGMSVAASDSAAWRGTDEGGKLKAAGTAFWNPPNTGATNSTLFSALPSGMMYHDGSFSGKGDFAVYWTSTPVLETQVWYRYLHTNETRIMRVDGYRPNTTPVRCVKD